jgi:hypothetical protein
MAIFRDNEKLVEGLEGVGETDDELVTDLSLDLLLREDQIDQTVVGPFLHDLHRVVFRLSFPYFAVLELIDSLPDKEYLPKGSSSQRHHDLKVFRFKLLACRPPSFDRM